MRPLVEQRGRALVWFRYPYLHSGPTEDIHKASWIFSSSGTTASRR